MSLRRKRYLAFAGALSCLVVAFITLYMPMRTSLVQEILTASGLSIVISSLVSLFWESGLAKEMERGTLAWLNAINANRGDQIEVPPPLAKFMLLLIPPKYREDVLGDLEEEYRTIILPDYGIRKARLWYWWQALFSVGAFLWQKLRYVAGFIAVEKIIK